MAESPASRNPYEILGVSPDVNQTELRRAYRRLLRQTHPDTGGDPERFDAVQSAWLRIGDVQARERWDSGGTASNYARFDGDNAADQHGTNARSRTAGSGVRARSYGHPGGVARERFLVLMREWAGRGAALKDPYEPALVRSAPREIRHLLASALTEEATARAVMGLGLGYTVWNDIATEKGKLDHVVLGPGGLFAMMSEDWGCTLRLVRGELVGDGIGADELPVRALSRLSRAFARSCRVRLTATLVVVPDESLAEGVLRIGKRNDSAVVGLSMLPAILRDGIGSGQRLSIEDVFDVRSRIQQSVNFA